MNQCNALFARHALLPDGWGRDVVLEWDDAGGLTRVHANAPCPAGARTAPGPVLPGMPNLHSHAFQRAFAGLTEFRSREGDDFWSWRTLMYDVANRIGPEQLEAIATHLYIEMLQAGYTSVCEFHYVHLDLHGRPYADDATLSLALLRAAEAAGIGLTLLPVLYQQSGFGGQAATAGQKRFIRGTDEILKLIETLRPLCRAQSGQIGLAPHSLRAVTPDSLHAALAGLRAQDPSAPVHIHIAEQQREVADCLAFCGQRPVEWLLDHCPVDEHWCLVHATHLTGQETQRLAASRAVAGLCPTTEANLGDGIFPAADYLARQGRWGIGSDSHASVSAAGELRLLEYGQRLLLRQRNVLASSGTPQVSAHLYLGAVAGGAQASGRNVAGLAIGQQADFVVLDETLPLLAGMAPQDQLASHVFAGMPQTTIREVWRAGACRVRDRTHAGQEAAATDFAAVRQALFLSPNT